MLNLSQMARESPQFSLLQKMRLMIEPDIYIADNIKDYKTSVDKLDFPLYKKCPYFYRPMARVYITFKNVGLSVIKDEKDNRIPSWFKLHDSTGNEVVYWDSKSNLVPTLMTYEEMQESQGFGENEFVYEVFTRYLLESGLMNVVEVRKYNTTKKEEPCSLTQRIKFLLPNFEGEWQPSY